MAAHIVMDAETPSASRNSTDVEVESRSWIYTTLASSCGSCQFQRNLPIRDMVVIDIPRRRRPGQIDIFASWH